MNNKPFLIAGVTIKPGEHKLIELPSASLYAQAPINIPVHVFHGKKQGPRIFISAAIHGDEINGVEIIRRLILNSNLRHIRGTLIAIPVANVHGFITLSRYLPDRRDLNRSFPGSKTGSLAARVANLYLEEIIQRCTHGIDLHTGNIHSDNLPHLRTNVDVPGTVKMARAFNVPVIVDAKIRDGSLRQAAAELNIPIIVYEAGEALRFNELAIRIGLKGVLNVLRSMHMIPPAKSHIKKIKPMISFYSTWARSPKSGIFHPLRVLGTDVEEGEKLGVISDPFIKKDYEIFSPVKGIIIGRNTLPLVNEGDALIHVAKLKGTEHVTSQIMQLENDIITNPYDIDE